jgi:hypothetical protein
MLLFQKRFWPGLIDGTITLTFRRWRSSHVKPGGRYRCHPIGVVEVDAVERASADAVSDDDACRAGFADRGELRAWLEAGEAGPLASGESLFRVTLHHGGDGDRVAGALDATLSPDDIERIRARLAKLDAASDDGPWTAKTLALIARRPRAAAGRLAESLGRDKLPFKADVVKLKKLGLTQSFEVGYELSPRGRAFLAASKKRARSATSRTPPSPPAAAARPRARARAPGGAGATPARGGAAPRR